MDWKKSLGAVMLMGVTVLSLAGCSNSEETAPAAASPSSSIQQPTPPSGNGTIPAPPEGIAPGEMPSGNGTMPAPPEGMEPGERPSGNGTMPAPPEGMEPGERPPMDLAAAAASLGVTEEELAEALNDAAGGPPDMQSAAEKLGVTEEALREALGMPEGGFTPDGPPPGTLNPEIAVQ